MIEIDIRWQRGAFDLRIDCVLAAAVTAVFGPSGSGKTSLLQCVAGLQDPDAGRIVVGDRVLVDTRRGVWLPPERRRIGMLFQDDRLFPHLGVRANLDYGRRLVPQSERRLAFDEVVEALEIGGLLDRGVAALSGGERQRVALGRALLTSPALLLLDEPLVGLDRRLKHQILPFLRRAQERFCVPILHVSHDLDDILQLTRHMLVIESGRQVAVGHFHEILGEPEVLGVARRLGLDNVLHARVDAHLDDEQLTRLRVGPPPGTVVLAPRTAAEPGSAVFIAIRPEDIALATEPHAGLSIQNQLEGRIRRLQDHGGRVLVEVDVGCPVVLDVSRRAAADLRLAADRDVVCLFKALGVRYLGLAETGSAPFFNAG